MKENYLLKSKQAQRLYVEHAKDLPIIDYHNHISVTDIAADRSFADLTELWLAPDPYKHRLMRICGVEEHYITGDASPREKFRRFCEVFPRLAGNPVYDWSRMELSYVFGINEIPDASNADRIYDAAGEMLRGADFSNNAILGRFRVAYQSPVAGILDDLTPYDGKAFAPSLRGDNLLLPNAELLRGLEAAAHTSVHDLGSYLGAVAVMLDRFEAAGCRFADHALDAGFTYLPDDGKNEARFAALLSGASLSDTDAAALRSEILVRLGGMYAAKKWNLLLHLDAKRKTSARLLRLCGPAGGYASVGGSFDLAGLCNLLGDMESRTQGLPKTVLFPLNLSDQAAVSVLEGSFSEDGVAAKVQMGPAWWWCDHRFGMENSFGCIASFGVLSEFIGMTTDSRSILSFVRHDYFRRVLCSYLADHAEHEDWEASDRVLGEIVEKICYQNALSRIEKGE